MFAFYIYVRSSPTIFFIAMDTLDYPCEVVNESILKVGFQYLS